jgi:tetratricopeptide (TPR) repeat protein
MSKAPAPGIDALWDYADPAGTAEKFEALLAEHGAAAGPAWQAQLLSQLARTHGLRADFATAHALLNRAAALLDSAAAEDSAALTLARVRIALERGRCHNSGGAPEDALPCFTQALELAQPAGLDNLAVDAAHMLGIAAPGEAGLAWNERAAAMAEASADPQARKWLGPLLNNTGWTLHSMGRYAEALDWFERSLAWRTAQGHARQVEIARWCIARCLRSLGQVEEALARQQKLAADIAARDAGTDDQFVCEEVGECLLALGRPDEARPHLARAYELLSQDKFFAVQNAPRLERLRQLAGFP